MVLRSAGDISSLDYRILEAIAAVEAGYLTYSKYLIEALASRGRERQAYQKRLKN